MIVSPLLVVSGFLLSRYGRNPKGKAHHPVPVRRRQAPPPCPPRPPPREPSSHRRPRLLSSTRDAGPRSPPFRGDGLLQSPSPSRSPFPPPPRRGRRRPTPSTITRRRTRETRTWTGASFCGSSRGRCRAPASFTRSGGGGGTRTRGTSASGSPATPPGGSAAGASPLARLTDYLPDPVILLTPMSNFDPFHFRCYKSHDF